jgi:hypothetical protein
MTSEGAPALDLHIVEGRNTAPEPVAAVPLKPTTLVGILGGIGEDLFTGVTTTGNPALSAPFTKREARVNAEIVDLERLAFRAQLPESNGSEKPLGGKLQDTVIQIFSLKYTECEHFTRIGPGFEIGGESPWFSIEFVRVPLSHAIPDCDFGADMKG